MKLNYKRTIFVGFAFFLICSFWQAYDNTIPLILTNKFGMSQAWSGVIMALDNVLALFMLPLFGAISDKHHSKWGRRTPFIVVGTLVAAVMLIALSFVDNAQLKHLSDVSAIDDPAALEQIYDRQADETLLTPRRRQVRPEPEVHPGGVLPDPQPGGAERQHRHQPRLYQLCGPCPPGLRLGRHRQKSGDPGVLHRTAADRAGVHGRVPVPGGGLMPDVTLKPLRSKANAVINLMAPPEAFWCWPWAWCSPPPPSATP